MEIENYYTACKIIFNHYGKQAQERQLIQELGELIVAITKGDLENIIEEMADVQVMIDQFTINSPYMDKKIINIQHDKALRQLMRIKKEKESKLNGGENKNTRTTGRSNNTRGMEKPHVRQEVQQKQEKSKK